MGMPASGFAQDKGGIRGVAGTLGVRTGSPSWGRSLKWAATRGVTLVAPQPSFHGSSPADIELGGVDLPEALVRSRW